jgi:hypothetical protein
MVTDPYTARDTVEDLYVMSYLFSPVLQWLLFYAKTLVCREYLRPVY